MKYSFDNNHPKLSFYQTSVDLGGRDAHLKEFFDNAFKIAKADIPSIVDQQKQRRR